MEPAPLVCPRCRSPLFPTAGGRVCPVCALELALSAAGGPDEPGGSEAFPRGFGGYELLGEIGRGGMGLVFKARQLSLGRIVALKVLLYGSFSDTAGRRRFRIEAESAARLQHPNIVAVHEVGELDGVPYLTMDLVDGPDLGELCAGRPLPASAAAPLLRDIAAAVQAAHDAGVLHRDLKPSNVLVGSDGRPRVSDFGLAKCDDSGASSGLTATGQALGSPSYASPEQAAGRTAEITAASDVYGLGAILYCLLTGRAPFVAATATQTLRLVLEAEPVAPRLLNPGVPRDLETICLKCLAKEPARRYATAAEVANDVEHFLHQHPIRARPPNVFYRMRRFVQRHRAAVAATAAGLLALGVGLAFAVAGFRRAVVQQRAADAARGQAEQLIGLMTRDLKPVLEQRGGLPQLLKTIEATVAYFESLPPELRTAKTDRALADALANLARVRGLSLNDRQGANQASAAALALREKIARAQPDDPEAVADWLWNAWERPREIGDWNRWHSYAWAADCYQRWQQLQARFPDNLRVKRGLAEIAWSFAEIAAGQNKPREALAAAQESRALVEQLVAALPGDTSLGELVQTSLIGLSTAYVGAGEPARAAAAAEQALACGTQALQADPANLSLRRRAADTARWVSYRVFPTSPRRGRDAELVAREHYRILSEANPGDQDVRALYALSHLMEGIYLGEVDGDRPAARDLLRKFDALLAGLPERNAHFDVTLFRAENSIRLARLAALDGNPDEARSHLQEARIRFAAHAGLLPEGSFERRLARVRHLQSLEWTACHLRDWPELGRLAAESATEIGAALKDQPANEELLLRRLETNCFRGLALQGAGLDAEAGVVLQEALNRLRESSPVYSVTDVAELQRTAGLALLQALVNTGDTAAARKLGDSMLATPEVAPSEGWFQQEWRARVCVAVAGLLGPGEAARRAGLLDAAEKILTAPGAEGRITVLGREDLATVRRLRAAAGNTVGLKT